MTVSTQPAGRTFSVLHHLPGTARRLAPAALWRPACAAIAIACATPAAATEEDGQLWLQAGANVNLGNGFRLSEELVARFSDNRHGLYELENNLLLGYAVSKRTTIWIAYTHDPQYNAGTFTVMEHRAREQVTFDNIGKLGPFAVSLRMRAEQRWRDHVVGTGWRLRPFARLQATIDSRRKIALALSHESFVDLNNTTFQRTKGYDRMRNQISLRTPVNKAVTLEVGYLNQYGLVAGGSDRMDHSATASLNLSL